MSVVAAAAAAAALSAPLMGFVRDGEQVSVARFDRDLHAQSHPTRVSSFPIAAEYSRDGRRLAVAGSLPGRLTFVSTRTGRKLGSMKTSLTGLVWPERRRLIGVRYKSIVVIDPHKRVVRRRVPMHGAICNVARFRNRAVLVVDGSSPSTVPCAPSAAPELLVVDTDGKVVRRVRDPRFGQGELRVDGDTAFLSDPGTAHITEVELKTGKVREHDLAPPGPGDYYYDLIDLVTPQTFAFSGFRQGESNHLGRVLLIDRKTWQVRHTITTRESIFGAGDAFYAYGPERRGYVAFGEDGVRRFNQPRGVGPDGGVRPDDFESIGGGRVVVSYLREPYDLRVISSTTGEQLAKRRGDLDLILPGRDNFDQGFLRDPIKLSR